MPHDIQRSMFLYIDILQSIIGLLATLVIVLYPPEATGAIVALYPLALTIAVLLHAYGLKKEKEALLAAASYAILLLAAPFAMIVYFNGALPMVLAPAFLSVVGVYFLKSPKVLWIIGGITLGTILVVNFLKADVDFPFAVRALVSSGAVFTMLLILQRYLSHLELQLSEVDKARQQLEGMVRKRNQLFGMIAHELRTPVSTIYMLTDTDSRQDWLAAQEAISDQANLLLSNIDDMRLLAQPDAKRELRTEPFSLAGFNQRLQQSVASILVASQMDFRLWLDRSEQLEDKIYVTDVYRLRTAVSNCIRNACLHSKGSKVWVVNRVRNSSEGAAELEWVVLDNGVGIEEDAAEQLFAFGERGATESDGSGLGLYIARQWLAEIGGTVEYAPAGRRGSRFYIRVPLQVGDRESHQQKSPIRITDESRAIAAKLKVLLVEDELMLRKLGQHLAEKTFDRVDVAEDGQQGLELFSDEYDLILTDYFMPHLTGAAMIKALRARGYAGGIIGVTAATIGEQQGELISAGADLVLSKPLTLEKLEGAVAQLIDQNVIT